MISSKNQAFSNPSALFDLSGKTALITGSGSGIGLGLARGLGAAGATIILNGRNEEKLTKAMGILSEAGISVKKSIFDVSQPVHVETAVAEIESTIGPIDILINNAGTNRRGSMADITPDDYRAVIKTNVDGAFFTSRAVSVRMAERGYGKIIHICSALSRLGRKNAVAYATSKGAVKMMTSAMCDELAPAGIQVNGIGPGYFLTELTEAIVNDKAHNDWLINRTPAGRWGELEDLVGAAVFLSSPASDFVNGQVLYVDGGLTSVMG